MSKSLKSDISNPFYVIFRVIIFIIVIFIAFKPIMRQCYHVSHIDIIEKHSSEYSLDKHLIMAVISVESKFNENAISRKDAKGLMQLKEKTAIWCMEQFDIESRDRSLYDPELNIQIGCAYLSYLLDKFDSNVNTALAAYNAGEGNVAKWLHEQNGVLTTIPFNETKKYVESVNQKMKIYDFLY